MKYLLTLIIPVMLISCTNNSGTVFSYHPVPGMTESDQYEVSVNNQKIWTEKYVTNMDIENLPDWFNNRPYTSVQQEVHFTSFSCEGPIEVSITVPDAISRAATASIPWDHKMLRSAIVFSGAPTTASRSSRHSQITL